MNQKESAVSFERAYEIVMGLAKEIPTESVSLLDSLNRILSQDVFSDIDMPPFNKSAMDGYACRSADLDGPMRVVETIPAGHKPEQTIGQGECAKIMTGAMIPAGADCVVMVEHARQEGNLVFATRKDGGDNICPRAEDVSAGQKVLTSGTLVTPSQIAVLASVGYAAVPVSCRVRVGIVATGSELVEPHQKPNQVQIRNSNSYQLCAQVLRAGAVPRYFGIAADDLATTDRVLKQAIDECDVILVSGGVSAGEFDFVRDVLRQNGIDLKFEKISVKPGRSTVFGVRDNLRFFGLPGNPVATFVIFEMLVRPFLARMMGADYQPPTVRARLLTDVGRKKSERLEFRPVYLQRDGSVDVISYHGSAHIHAYSQANATMKFPQGVVHYSAGQEVDVMLLD